MIRYQNLLIGLPPQRGSAGRWWRPLVFLLSTALLGAGPESAFAGSIPRSVHTQDSLRAQLRRTDLSDTMRARTLRDLCWQLRQSDLPAARRYGEQSLALARRVSYRAGELSALAELSSVAASSQEYLRAEQLAQEVVRRAGQGPRPMPRLQVKGLEGIAMVATAQNQPERAAQYYRQALAVQLAHQPELAEMLPMTYLGLASAYYTQRQLGNKADSIDRQVRRYARAARALARQQKAPLMEAASLQLLALSLQAHQQIDSAAVLMQQALKLYQANNATYNVTSALLLLSDLNIARNQPAQAATLARQARQLANTVQDANSELIAYSLLGQALAAQGQGLAAYTAAMAAQRIGDSVQGADNAQALNELQVKFDTERKEGRIRVLTQQQRLQQEKVARQQQGLWALGGILAAVAAGLAAVWALAVRLRRNRAQLAVRNVELERARASQDRLYAVVAHDLRGPLAAFQGLGPLIRYYREQGEADAIDEIAGEVSQTADQCTRLLDNLLHYAATQAGELRYRPEALPAVGLLTEIAALYAPAVRAARVTLTVVPTPGATVYADRTMTLTVLRNLTHNALKISPVGSTITLAAEATPDGRIAFTITDQGPGLTPERLAELVGADPGAANTPTHGPEEGTGLGLPLVRQLVRRQQGEFGLTSQPGVGTTARVALPEAQATDKAPEPAERGRGSIPVVRRAAAQPASH